MKQEIIKLRAHHLENIIAYINGDLRMRLLMLPMTKLSYGEKMAKNVSEITNKLKASLNSGHPTEILVVKDLDSICEICPYKDPCLNGDNKEYNLLLEERIKNLKGFSGFLAKVIRKIDSYSSDDGRGECIDYQNLEEYGLKVGSRYQFKDIYGKLKDKIKL